MDAEQTLVGGSDAMAALRTRLRLVAPSSEPALVTGPSGSGKELVAAAIHTASGRSGAFVAVNCAAVPGDLLESEFFGHERGAFSGALARRDGHVAAAAGGTLFLDE
ncbi:MAG: sigma 54-interacting transcriptional regulator, partial [Alphaproteobacteria bacterium]|nr:sigma 54-interacting transcriptional regulator [Alphaproteobacteria bacterium]